MNGKVIFFWHSLETKLQMTATIVSLKALSRSSVYLTYLLLVILRSRWEIWLKLKYFWNSEHHFFFKTCWIFMEIICWGNTVLLLLATHWKAQINLIKQKQNSGWKAEQLELNNSKRISKFMLCVLRTPTGKVFYQILMRI